MITPTVIRNFASTFFGDEVVCLGRQLIVLVRAVRECRPDLRWYSADVDPYEELFGPRSPDPVLRGSADTVIRLADQVVQFTSGVFVGVPPSITTPTFRDGGLWTEDPEDADLGDAVIELRTFDYSFISVAVRESTFMNELLFRLDGVSPTSR